MGTGYLATCAHISQVIIIMAEYLHKRNKMNKLKYCYESKKQVVYAYLITTVS